MTLAAMLWFVFMLVVVMDVFYISRTRALFDAMYEGLGSALPTATRFFLSGPTHVAAFAAIPFLALLAGIAWRIRARVGLLVLILASLLAAGWGLAYRHAMKMPMEQLQHAFDNAS